MKYFLPQILTTMNCLDIFHWLLSCITSTQRKSRKFLKCSITIWPTRDITILNQLEYFHKFIEHCINCRHLPLNHSKIPRLKYFPPYVLTTMYCLDIFHDFLSCIASTQRKSRKFLKCSITIWPTRDITILNQLEYFYWVLRKL